LLFITLPRTSKKNNKITHCKVLTREQEQKKVAAQEFRKFLAMVDDNCHKNKTFEELQKQAAASYALTLTNGKFKRESAKIGMIGDWSLIFRRLSLRSVAFISHI